MSRIGNNPITIPEGVTVDVQPTQIHVKGKLGELTQDYSEVQVVVEENTIKVVRPSEKKSVKSKHGLYRSLIANMIEGVSNGFTKELELVGVGYKAAPKGKTLELNLGFSHPINFQIPDDLKIEVPKPTAIKISGIDKQRVGQIAANIRSFRKPEPYKGKGVKYKDEYVRRKEGKKK